MASERLHHTGCMHKDDWSMSPALQTAAYSRQLHFRFHPAAVDLWGQRARCHHGEILIRQITKTLELKQLSGCALKSKHICCWNQKLKEPKLLNKDRSPALLQGWHCVLALHRCQRDNHCKRARFRCWERQAPVMEHLCTQAGWWRSSGQQTLVRAERG